MATTTSPVPASWLNGGRWLPALLVGVILAACQPDGLPRDREHRRIVGGQPAPGDPAVVAIAMRRTRCEVDPAVALCTGTLITEQVVVTAGHCLERLGARELEVYFGSRVGDGVGEWRLVVETEDHPGFDDDAFGIDVALLRLDAPAPVPPALVLRSTLDASLIGQSVRLVGFGDTRNDGIPTGTKVEGTAVVTAMDATSFTYQPDPAMTCHGDSGGPAFVTLDGSGTEDASEWLAGITSFGDPACAVFGLNVRLDPLWDGFIRPFIDRALPVDDPGVTVAGLCSEPCQEDPDCPEHLVCVTGQPGEGQCILPGRLPGAMGEVCATDAECSEQGSTCVRLRSDGEEACRCSVPCEATTPPVEDPDGCGCSASRGCGGLSLLLLVMGWIVLVARRRQADGRASPSEEPRVGLNV